MPGLHPAAVGFESIIDTFEHRCAGALDDVGIDRGGSKRAHGFIKSSAGIGDVGHVNRCRYRERTVAESQRWRGGIRIAATISNFKSIDALW